MFVPGTSLLTASTPTVTPSPSDPNCFLMRKGGSRDEEKRMCRCFFCSLHGLCRFRRQSGADLVHLMSPHPLLYDFIHSVTCSTAEIACELFPLPNTPKNVTMLTFHLHHLRTSNPPKAFRALPHHLGMLEMERISMMIPAYLQKGLGLSNMSSQGIVLLQPPACHVASPPCRILPTLSFDAPPP